MHEDIQHAFEFVSFVVGGDAQLRVCEQRVEHAQVGMAQGGCVFGQVEQVSNQNVDQHVQVVGVEVFVRWGGCE